MTPSSVTPSVVDRKKVDSLCISSSSRLREKKKLSYPKFNWGKKKEQAKYTMANVFFGREKVRVIPLML